MIDEKLFFMCVLNFILTAQRTIFLVYIWGPGLFYERTIRDNGETKLISRRQGSKEWHGGDKRERTEDCYVRQVREYDAKSESQ